MTSRTQTLWRLGGMGLWLLACSHDATHTGDGIGCEQDPRADTYAAELRHVGTAGRLTFVLQDCEPAPPARGANTWVVHVLDSRGAARTDVDLRIHAFMPDHGHGTSETPEIAAQGTAYRIQNLDLFMPGLWQVTLTATDAGQQDSAAFSFCIAG